MEKLTIFGRDYLLEVRRGSQNAVRVAGKKVVVLTQDLPPNRLLENFLADALYRKLCRIFDRMRREGRAEIFGNVDFEVVKSISGNKRRIARLRGHAIKVRLDAVALPEPALRYVIAHELAHITTGRHSREFWRILRTIYPDYEEGQKLLVRR